MLAKLRPTPTTYLVRLPYNAGVCDARIHRAMRQFHPGSQFAWWSHSTVDYAIASHYPEPNALEAACIGVAREMEADPALPGAVVLLHEAPFDIPVGNAAMVARFLLTGILAALERRGLHAGALRPTPASASCWVDRHFLRPSHPRELWQLPASQSLQP
jgi:hypothetical protein